MWVWPPTKLHPLESLVIRTIGIVTTVEPPLTSVGNKLWPCKAMGLLVIQYYSQLDH